MDEAKLALAVNWFRSVVEKARISPSITNFELADIDDGRFRLTFEMAGAERLFICPRKSLKRSRMVMRRSGVGKSQVAAAGADVKRTPR